jgi:translation initiation factor 1
MKNSRPVYSTETGRLCPACGRAQDRCRCSRKKAREIRPRQGLPADGVVRVQREVKGRKGKAVTAVYGLSLTEKKLRDFARTLKQRCGAGGSVKNGVILVQGDHRDALVREIEREGYTVKAAGG